MRALCMKCKPCATPSATPGPLRIRMNLTPEFCQVQLSTPSPQGGCEIRRASGRGMRGTQLLTNLAFSRHDVDICC